MSFQELILALERFWASIDALIEIEVQFRTGRSIEFLLEKLCAHSALRLSRLGHDKRVIDALIEQLDNTKPPRDAPDGIGLADLFEAGPPPMAAWVIRALVESGDPRGISEARAAMDRVSEWQRWRGVLKAGDGSNEDMPSKAELQVRFPAI